MNNPLSIDNNISDMDENIHDPGAAHRSSICNGSGSAKIAVNFFYGCLFLVVTFVIGRTQYLYSLFPIQYDNFEWNQAWLVASVFDFYGVCLCFAGVVLSSESSWIKGIVWIIGFVTLGSPVCCIWVLLRIRNHGSLRLMSSSSDAPRRDV